jgi:hypothetical protein
MASPSIPPLTCDYIDQCIALLDTIVETDEHMWRHQLSAIVQANLEFIRTSNDALRESGIYWHEAHKKLQKKR